MFHTMWQSWLVHGAACPTKVRLVITLMKPVAVLLAYYEVHGHVTQAHLGTHLYPSTLL